jgi:hypothetical protein
MLDGTYHIDCDCGSIEHSIRFVVSKYDNSAYADVYLYGWQPWYKRPRQAVRYLFNMPVEYGHWSCTILAPGELDTLDQLLKKSGPQCSWDDKNPTSLDIESRDHTLRFCLTSDKDSGPEIHTEVHLLDGPWYKRLWRATRYLLGHKCRYGNWDCFEFDRIEIQRLRGLIQDCQEQRKTWLETFENGSVA